MLPEYKEIWQRTLDWCPSPEQQQQFEQLYQEILAGNRQLNLTRITDPEAFWEKHLWDSLRGITPLNWETLGTAFIIDIGTGGGFPGLPCAIALPKAKITLLDATRKKIAYLNAVTRKLARSRVKAIAGRAEILGKEPDYHQQYDIALLRAVADATVCAQYAFPFLKTGGIAVLYRGRWSEEEAKALQLVLPKLGGKLETVETFATPLTESERNCLYLKKTKGMKKL